MTNKWVFSHVIVFAAFAVVFGLMFPIPTHAQVSTPQAVTSGATGITFYSVTLNGSATTGDTYFVTSWFEYGTTPSLGSRTPSQFIGGQIQIVLTGLSPSTTYYFRIAVQGQSGVSYGQVMTFTTLALPNYQYWGGTYQSPQGTQYTPSNQYIPSYNPSQGYGGAPSSYPQTSYAPTSAEYLSAQRAAQGLPPLAPTGPVAPASTNPSVTTEATIAISESSATVRASVIPNGHSATAWFEYGVTSDFGSETSHRVAGSGYTSLAVSETIKGLESGTLYYVRPVAQVGSALYRGATATFRTLGAKPVGATPSAPAPSSSSTSSDAGTPPGLPVSPLAVTTLFQSGAPGSDSDVSYAPKPGDEFKYVVTYRNTATSTLKDVVVVVVMPKNVSYISSSPLPLSVSDNIVTVPIGTVYPYGEGQTVIAMKLDASALANQKLDFVSFALERGGVRSAPLLQSRVSVDTGKTSGTMFSPLASLTSVFKNVSGWVLLLGAVLLLLAIYFISRYIGDREEARAKKTRYESESPLAETERKISKSVQDEIRAQLGLDEEESLAN